MTTGQFFWVVTKFPYPNGHLVIIGPYTDSGVASEKAYLELESPFEVVELPTRDRSRATAILKKRNLSNTGDLGSSLQKAGHQPPKSPNASGTTPDISPNDPNDPYSPY